MIKSYTVALLLILFALSSQGQAPVIQWDRNVEGFGQQLFTCLQQTTDGGYILGGLSSSNPGVDKTEASRGVDDYWIVKLDANGAKLWDRTLGSGGYDVLSSLQQTADGGFILGGYSTRGPASAINDMTEPVRGIYDYWVVKLTSTGQKQWDHTFGGSDVNWLTSLQQTADGGYILGGQSNSGITNQKSQASQGDLDYWIIKLDASGTKQWDRTYGGSGREELAIIRQTADGGYIVGGLSESPASGDKTQPVSGSTDYWVLKLNFAGTLQWEHSYGGNQFEVLTAVLQTTDGGYLLGGHSNSGIGTGKTHSSRGGYDYWVVKADANGTQQWDRTYGGDGTDRLHGMQQTADGGYIFGGASASSISGEKSQRYRGTLPELDYWLVKTNAQGILVWDLTLGGNRADELQALQQTSDGGYILGGNSDSPVSGEKTRPDAGVTGNWWIVKIKTSLVAAVRSAGLAPVIQAYPNPTHGSVRITQSIGESPLLLTTIEGRELGRWPAGSKTVYLENMKPGMYILRQGYATMKLVVE
jgi:hypothetical protein